MWQSLRASVTFACVFDNGSDACQTCRRSSSCSPACRLRGCATERAALQWATATRQDTFIHLAIETYGALLSQTYDFLRECARRAFSEHGGSSPSTSVLVTWSSSFEYIEQRWATATGHLHSCPPLDTKYRSPLVTEMI